MTRRKEDPWIELTVTNPETMRFTGTVRKGFDRDGGTIGSRGADWILLDTAQGIAAVHCEVVTVDGAFCLIDRSGLTRMNRSESGMGLRRIALLRDGDTITVGDLRIAVHVFDRSSDRFVVNPEEERCASGVFADTHPSDDLADIHDDSADQTTAHARHGFFADIESDALSTQAAYPSPSGGWDQAFVASHRVLSVVDETIDQPESGS